MQLNRDTKELIGRATLFCTGTAICVTFCARDKRRSNPVAALRWAEGVRAFFEAWMSGR